MIFRTSGRAFTLVELMVVVAVVGILAAVLYPVFTRASLSAKVARVHSDLKQIGDAIDMYTTDCGGLPPVRSCCTGSSRWDYNELPIELHKMHYLSTEKMYDPFNRTRGDDDKLGRTYKYVAVNWGYTAGNKSWFSMWIPRDYPTCSASCILYYKYAGRIYAYDKGATYPKDPPIMWAIWSVGPSGDPGIVESGTRLLPMPRSEWFPRSEVGVIARFSDGRKSP